MDRLVNGKTWAEWGRTHPLIPRLTNGEPVFWLNPNVVPFSEAQRDIELNAEDITAAEERLERFAPYLAEAFPEVAASLGIIESELKPVPELAAAIARRYAVEAPQRVLMKMDSHLPISGSVKARGGIYEVLHHAEQLAFSEGLLNHRDNYRRLLEPAAQTLFSRRRVVVGSTGNLGMSIGLAASRLGFLTTVHMSDDARAWKKDRLRANGVQVVEHAGDYGLAVEQGRKESAADLASHFVDDEHSRVLFLGYAVGGLRLKAQLDALGVVIGPEAPLVVYLPCGVGGGPGGISFGLKQAFGDSVHCVFAEPTQSPCMLLGMYTGLHDKVCVGDFGISNHTAADGLAVDRPSGFVGPAMHRMVAGIYTLNDDEMYALLFAARDTQDLKLEPSALAGAPGFARLQRCKPHEVARLGLSTSAWNNATHVIWATGGGMVPDDEYEKYLADGRRAYFSNFP